MKQFLLDSRCRNMGKTLTFLPVLLAAALLVIFAGAVAQSQTPAASGSMAPSAHAGSEGIVVRQLNTPATPPLFRLDKSPNAKTLRTLELRTPAQMTEPDRARVTAARASIEERARFAGFSFDNAAWSYHQVVCPALPNHLLLQFVRKAEAGNSSRFSVVVPRDSAGHVRVLPVERRGFALFSPAPVNASTVALFNRISAEEHRAEAPDWLTLGLCYATLAGAQPRAELAADTPENERFPESMAATLITEKDGATIGFVDASAKPHAMLWSMKFNRKGQLVKVTHKPADLTVKRPLNQPLVELDAAH